MPGLLVACLATSVVPSLRAQPAPEEANTADRQSLEHLYEEHGIQRQAPAPGLGEWFGQAFDALISRWTSRVDLGAATPSRRLLKGIAWLVIGTGLGALILALIAWFTRRRPVSRVPVDATIEAAEPRAGPVDWRVELTHRLDRGDTFGALEALWWWLAGRLAEPGARPRTPASWTGRELIRRSRRPDLADCVSVLDRLRYGPLAPQAADVRSLFEEFEGRMR